MNIFLWVVQVLLALHTVMGAVWKFSHGPQSVASLRRIPKGAWISLSVFELVCAVGLVLPACCSSLALLAPLAALGIAAEMLLFCAVHLSAGAKWKGPTNYWLVVALVCAFVAYGRFVLSPLS